MIREDGDFTKTNAQWVSEDTTPDPDPLPEVVGWKLIIRPVQIIAKTKKGILLPEAFRDDMAYLTTVGRVLAVGPLAYKDPKKFGTKAWCKTGDFVTYGKFAGAKFLYKGVRLLLLNDDEILFKLQNPADLDPSLNLSTF
jgi:co-chaperonin GroES (HSP10)